jgi:putative phage-type endonuclease
MSAILKEITVKDGGLDMLNQTSQGVQLKQDRALIDRNLFLGGSDIAAIMGLSRWSSPLRLWAEKTGKIEHPDLSDNEAVEMGRDLEEFVAQKFSQRTGKTVRRAPKKYTHKDYDFLAANVDRLITDSDELLECKTCTLWKKDEWEEGIPQEYVLQVIWYLGITGRKTGWIAVLIGGQKFMYKQIDFDAELFKIMVEKAIVFWQMVQEDIAPEAMPQDGDTLFELFPNSTDDLIENQEIEERVAYLQEVKMQISDMKDEQKKLETELKTLINEKAGILTQKYKVTWKTQVSRQIDTQTLKVEMPDIAKMFTSERISRVLRVAINKEVA